MSALDRITDKHTKSMTKLEFAIFMLWNSFSEDGIAGQAAEELAAKDAELYALRESLDEEKKRNELFSDCLRRGLKLWQAENPERDYWISGDENIKWMLDQIAALRERVEALEAALSVTTQAYLAILKEQEWTTSDGHPAEWHALIVSNKELLQAP